jgi:hypothetical protein
VTDTTCAYHHSTPAVAACASCEKPVCGVCTRTVNSAALCSGCAVGRETQKSWLAGAFALLLPGSGQVYNGQLGKGAAVFLLAPLVLPWLWGVYDAATTAEEIASGRRAASTVPTGGMLLALKILWVPVAFLYGGLLFALIAGITAGIGALAG